MADIKKLLNKRGWTGKELGILELTNMAVVFGQALRGEEPTPLIEVSQLQKMVNDIKDRTQGQIYNNYIAIHEWLSVKYNIAQTQMQQAQLQYRTLERYVLQATLAEDTYRYIEQLPLIMTQKQYDETKSERIEARFKDDEGNELHSDIFNLIERAVGYYLHLLETEPRKANPLKAIKKKYEKEPVKSKLILETYNKAADNGYFTLEDGRRSDQMTSEEWQKAITTPKMAKALEEMKAEDETGREFASDVARIRLLNRAKVLYNGGTDEEAARLQEIQDYENGLAVPVEWHYYEDPPEDLTKWDIIEDELLLLLYPYAPEGEDPYSKKNFNASMKDFAAEFPELVKAMLSDMDKKYFAKDELKASDVPIKEWHTTTISWRRLYDLDFYGEQKKAEDEVFMFSGDLRAAANGIAILTPSDLPMVTRNIDERGYYVEPQIKNSLSSMSLEAFFPESEEYALNLDIVESSTEQFKDSYYFLAGYNYAIEKIAEIHDIPEFTVFKSAIEAIEERIDDYNELIPLLYQRICVTNYGNKELQARKLEVLRDIFQPIDYESIVMPEETKAEIDAMIEDFSAFKTENTDRFYNLLCVRPDSEEFEDGEGA